MSDAYLGEIRMFAGFRPPRCWTFCNGQLLKIADYPALFALLGTLYGGDGRTDFALPDYRGRLPVHAGQGPGLEAYKQGQNFGSETVTVAEAEMPVHQHRLVASANDAGTNAPAGAVLSKLPVGSGFVDNPASDKLVDLSDHAVASAGGGVPHSNLMPTLCVSFIICLQGLYPSKPN